MIPLLHLHVAMLRVPPSHFVLMYRNPLVNSTFSLSGDAAHVSLTVSDAAQLLSLAQFTAARAIDARSLNMHKQPLHADV